MKLFLKSLALTAMMASSAVILPVSASAQVAGVATADQTVAIARTKAFSAAYQQISTTFASNRDIMIARSKELNDLRKSLDTNNDNQLDQAEMDAAVRAKSPTLTSIDAKEKEINQLQEPIVKAQIYAVEQIAAKYPAAQQQVVTAKKINMILAPDAFIWAPDAIDITPAIVTALDTAVPSVGITAPADWRPQRNSLAIHQQLDQLLNAARAQAAQQQAQPGAAPAAQPESR